jgi:predicted MPP superfamily phosphohydrolase
LSQAHPAESAARVRVRRAAFVLLCTAGAFGGALVGGRMHTAIGPFHATVSLRASWTGDTVVRLPPLGTLTLDTHDGPFGLAVTADELDLKAARQVVEDPNALGRLERDAVRDGRRALRWVALRAALGSFVGAFAVAALRSPTRRTLAVAAVTALLTTAVGGGVARATWNRGALAEPRYTGLLTVAPQAIGSIARIQARYAAYRSQLAELIANVTKLYNTTAGLTSFNPEAGTIRALHVSDIHLNPEAFDLIDQLVKQFKIDVVFDTGDINDWGTAFEAPFVSRIGSVGVPYVFVRGNHDSATTAAAVASQANAVVLDGDARTVAGLTVWGIGDPRFTPDKTTGLETAREEDVADRFAPEVAQRARLATPIDVALVHDPRVGAQLGGISPLVLAGHLHKTGVRQLSGGTTMLVEGSTGGAGLRALQQNVPVPLSCSVLYFDRTTGSLQAYDRVTVAGLGDTGARIERHVVSPRNVAPSEAPLPPPRKGA